MAHFYRGDRHYTPAELELFASYSKMRARHRPTTCQGDSPCWVEDGPPAIDKWQGRTRCRGCGGTPSCLGRLRHLAAPLGY